MDSFEDEEEQAPNPYRGCKIGACFACGLGGGKSKVIEWQSRRPNPLPMFVFANEFYTPMLLPGMYLPFEFVSSEISETTPFHTIDDPELAKNVAAFLDHETVHRHLLAGVVPMVIRLLASRCYRQLALLTKRFRPSTWEEILLQSKNIEDLYWAIAPLQEVVANLLNMVLLKGNPYALNVGEQSLDTYKMAYGKGFEKVLDDFTYIIKCLKEWFAPSPIEPFIIYILAEYMLMGAIDESEVKADLFTPTTNPKRRLAGRFLQVGMPYFVLEKQPPTYSLHSFTYTAHDITGRLEELKSGIQKAQFRRSKKPLTTKVEQLVHIAKAIPTFYKWLQSRDKIAWLKRRVLDGISEMQDVIKGMGFNLPLLEVWQSDISPYISVITQNTSTGKVTCFNYGMQEQPFAKKIGEQLERYRPELRKHMSSDALIIYCLQSDRTVGTWFNPGFEGAIKVPITPSIRFVRVNDGAAEDLVRDIRRLTIFESLREQIASGEGISCVFRQQNGGRCCGAAGLMWSIYEAGVKARDINELNWKPTRWIEPDCSRTDNE